MGRFAGWSFAGFEDFWRLDQALEEALDRWQASPGAVRSAGRRLLAEIEAYVEAYMSLDPLGRSPSYLINLVPMSAGKRRFLRAALGIGPLTSATLRDFCEANGLGTKRARRGARPAKRAASSGAASSRAASSRAASSARAAAEPLFPECPCCPKVRLAEKSVRTFRDPVTDSWSSHRMWRCPKCHWRSMVQDGDSEWSRTPPEFKPGAELGDSLRSEIKQLLGRRKQPPARLRALGTALARLFEEEKEIDRVFVKPQARRRRALWPCEIDVLMRLLGLDTEFYRGELKAHWDKMVKAQRLGGWAHSGLFAFLVEHPMLAPASFRELLALPRCEACRVPMTLRSRRFVDCGASVPNPIGLRDEWVCEYECLGCEARAAVRSDA